MLAYIVQVQASARHVKLSDGRFGAPPAAAVPPAAPAPAKAG